ncbi:MAG: peptidylprolyl isomerase [Thermodesulfobacteriota bacterium]|jgi:FKBP-type peptidyl-prolyl cis-trans isomerase SlyD|nr:MAG: peptidylprolyl isomerase [Thermodesulfobacteriota bacterium]
MQVSEIGTYVRIKYTVRLESGEILKGDPNEGLECMDFISGFDQVLPGLEKRLIGLNQGDEITLTIPPEEAFGFYDPSLVKEKNFSEFPEGKTLESGKWVLAKNDKHKITCGYFVKEKGLGSVILDYNHPFAGRTLTYCLNVVEVRPATQAELKIVKPCDFEPATKKKVWSTDLGIE